MFSTYKKRLKAFNQSLFYQQEKEFLYGLMQPGKIDDVLDYGCGSGYLVNDFNKRNGLYYGYDVNYKNLIYEIPRRYDIKYKHIYFMHSMAHIPNIKKVLINLKDGLYPGGKIHVITPNKNWMKNMKQDYDADPTVIKHFTPSSLQTLFFSCGYNIPIMGQLGTYLNGSHARIFLTATL